LIHVLPVKDRITAKPPAERVSAMLEIQLPLPHGKWVTSKTGIGVRTSDELEKADAGAVYISSKAFVSRMLPHKVRRKCSPTCAQLGVSLLYAKRVICLANASMDSAIIRMTDITRTPFGWRDQARRRRSSCSSTSAVQCVLFSQRQ